MWNSEFSPNKWVFEKSTNIHLLQSLIQIHPHFWCKYYYTKTLYLSSFFLYVEILLYLVGKVLDNRYILIKGSFRPNWTKLSWYIETEIVEKSNFSNMKSAKKSHGLKTVFYLVLVVNIWWFIKIWSPKIPTI